ncbi:Efflux pump [Lachnellula occidentalis]|uniref:Efflux pump n=1 Tax=Lachnellula occidentalis TaxID=215460 RepID=A0A8H8RR18_9HELO|nr:Efflux pump [Lachnellula occidentalis]
MAAINNSQTNVASSMETNDLNEKKVDTPGSSSDLIGEIAATQPEVLTGYQLYLLIFSLSLAGFIYSLDVTIIVTVTAFIFIIIFELGSLICGVAPSSLALVIGRAVAGIGGAGIFNGCLTIIAQSTSKEQRGRLVALLYMFSMVGIIISPIIGGALTERASWRWCFYINLPAGGVTMAVLAFVRIPETRQKSDEKKQTFGESINRLDPIGFALFAPTTIMLLIALQWGGSTHPWNSSTIIGLFVGFGLSLIVFLFWENRRGDTAMIPLSMLRQHIFYSSCLVTAAQYGSMNLFAYYLPVWFQTILGVDPILSGVYFMATAATLIVTMFATGVVAAKLGTPGMFSILGNGIAAIGGGLMGTFTPSSHTAAWAGFQVLSALGRGMTLQQPINAVQQTLEPAKMAVGTSIVVFCQFFGGALILAVAEVDFSASLRSALKQYAPGVDAEMIFDVGAAGVRDAVTSEQLGGVLRAYNQAVVNVFYLGCAASGLAFLAAWGMGLGTTKKSKPADVEEV